MLFLQTYTRTLLNDLIFNIVPEWLIKRCSQTNLQRNALPIKVHSKQQSVCPIWRWDLQPAFATVLSNFHESKRPIWHGIQSHHTQLATDIFILNCLSSYSHKHGIADLPSTVIHTKTYLHLLFFPQCSNNIPLQ
jgi:hypothetical protein